MSRLLEYWWTGNRLNLLNGCWGRMDSKCFVCRNPKLQIFLYFLESEGDSVEIELAFLTIWSGLVVLLDDFVRVGLVVIFAKVIPSFSDEPYGFNIEDGSKEGMQASGWKFILFT